ncbi:MAG: hypothetical protein ACXWQO_10140, partial [Bdellovibrionota bacterium]
MSPRIWTLTALIALISPLAHAELALPLQIAENSNQQRYATSEGNACLILDAGRALGDRDADG